MTIDSQIVIGALIIFALRILGVAISTVRMLILVQGRKGLSSVLGFFETLVFALAIGPVVNELNNIWNLMAYSGGFAVGTYVGMMIEARFIVNFVTVTAVSAHDSHKIADAIREAGHGATEAWGQGADGLVGSVRTVLRRREVQRVVKVINEIDPDAFVTMDETRAVRHGYVR